nr:PREDICTED: serpin B3 [Anolis carolinensis]|eukprot:XP_016851212.1 PREDICTED: serpin B3 [Anolis carolinensis]
MTTLPEANAKFAINTYHRLREEHPCENLLFSPVNATSALGLLAYASGCEQAAEIEKVLHWDEVNECIGSLNRRYLGAIRSFGRSATMFKVQEKEEACQHARRPEPTCSRPRQHQEPSRPEPTCPRPRQHQEPSRPEPTCPRPRQHQEPSRPEPTCPRPRQHQEPSRPEPTCPRPRQHQEPSRPEPTCPRPRQHQEPSRPEPTCPRPRQHQEPSRPEPTCPRPRQHQEPSRPEPTCPRPRQHQEPSRPEPTCDRPRQHQEPSRPEPTCPRPRQHQEPSRPEPTCARPRQHQEPSRPEPTCARPRQHQEPSRPEPTCGRPRQHQEPSRPEPTCDRPRARPEPVCHTEPDCPERDVPDYECDSPDGIHTAFSKILATLNAPSTNYTLSFANKLYGDHAIAFIQKFIYCALKLYWSHVEGADIHDAPEEVRRIINLWVEVQTHGKIKCLLPKDSFDCLLQLLMVNALYFKGQWEVKFDKALTIEAPFYPHCSDVKECYSVQLMNRKGVYNTGILDICSTQVQVLEIPYKNHELSLYILLPLDCSQEALEQLEEALTHEHLLEWSCHLKPEEVDVFIPKFSLEKSLYLHEYLGLHDLSDPEKADFSRATCTEGAALTQFVHDTFIEIDEEGGEEAEAPRCRDRRQHREVLEFVANHPFLYFIHHNCTQSLIALGRFAKPE